MDGAKISLIYVGVSGDLSQWARAVAVLARGNFHMKVSEGAMHGK
jgi:hypothetical protein